MDINGFRKAISKSFTKNIIIGTCITAFGVFIAWLILSGADSEMDDIPLGGMIVIWTLAGLCFFFGGVITMKHIREAINMRTGKHPIINAIESGDQGFLVWIYENVISVQGGGSDHQIWSYTKDGDHHVLSIKGKRVQEVLKYLKEQFPNVVVGYSDEIKDNMSRSFGKKLK